MPQPEPSPSVTSTPRSGRRLISRITSPFASKTRNVTDFYVQIPDVHKQYGPGETVTGAVHLRVVKPIRVTHVVVCLHGYAQVYKNPGCPPAGGYRANSTQVGTGRGSRTGEYFGNGFASLFEDEVVLCGEGKLGEGAYQFEFNLEFPDRDLPSSISFERGTISYMITATITRPTTISPTIQCDRKVYFVESIDISTLLPPKARTITLEAISRRTKAKSQAKRLVDSERLGRKGDSKVGSSERRDSQTSSSPSVPANGERSLQSPSPSEISFDSLLTGSQGRPSQHESNANSPGQSDVSNQKAANGNSSVTTRTINATVESLKGGCLRGDHIPVKVHVNHIKHVKSLHGVIITLYRQARVDMHPSIPLGPTEKGKEARYEDYYPKSTTGLGGLSLSGTGSSHMFRKDLSQTVVPLIVDPNSLTAEVTGKVHVDAEEFPTILTVPGAMISFRYYIEVVIDIQGKLSTQDRNLGNLGGLANTLIQGPTTPGVERGGRSAYQGSGTPLIDTAGLRRNKGVVSCTFEVVVGTKDSERSRDKGKQRAGPTTDPTSAPNQRQPASLPVQYDAQHQAEHEGENTCYGNEWYGYENGYDPQYYQYHYHPYSQQGHPAHDDRYHHPVANGNGYHNYNGYAPAYIAPPPIPIPAPEDESRLTEKERIHRAEQRLLPSQPPDADGQASAGAAPSAPYLPDEQPNGSFANAIAPPAFTLHPPPMMAAASTSGTTFVPLDYASSIPLPRTPVYEEREGQSYLPSTPAYEERGINSLTPVPSRTGTLPPTDDKRELERRNLQMEASAPPSDDAEQAGPSSVHAPSAPALYENDELYGPTHDSHANALASSTLPEYTR